MFFLSIVQLVLDKVSQVFEFYIIDLRNIYFYVYYVLFRVILNVGIIIVDKVVVIYVFNNFIV